MPGTTLANVSPAKRAATAATVASHLLDVGELAQGLSLVAKNARTLVAGAGDGARGLGVIAEHFSELADSIISLTGSIGVLAIQLSRASVTGWRGDNTLRMVTSAKTRARDARFSVTLDRPLEDASAYRDECYEAMRGVVKEINVQLSELHDCMRTCEVISVTFLLEASQAGQNETSLVGMAEMIDSISKSIRSKLSTSKNYL